MNSQKNQEEEVRNLAETLVNPYVFMGYYDPYNPNVPMNTAIRNNKYFVSITSTKINNNYVRFTITLKGTDVNKYAVMSRSMLITPYTVESVERLNLSYHVSISNNVITCDVRIVNELFPSQLILRPFAILLPNVVDYYSTN